MGFDDITPQQRQIFRELVVEYGLTHTTNTLTQLGLPEDRIKRLVVDWILSS